MMVIFAFMIVHIIIKVIGIIMMVVVACPLNKEIKYCITHISQALSAVTLIN